MSRALAERQNAIRALLELHYSAAEMRAWSDQRMDDEIAAAELVLDMAREELRPDRDDALQRAEARLYAVAAVAVDGDATLAELAEAKAELDAMMARLEAVR